MNTTLAPRRHARVVLFERLEGRARDTLGAAWGVAGLVAITPCVRRPMAATRIGFVAGALLLAFFSSVSATTTLSDVVGVHLVGGVVGSLLLGLFAERAFNPRCTRGCSSTGAGADGDQLIAVGATLLWSGVSRS
jgi:Amt family ammonium transporter